MENVDKTGKMPSQIMDEISEVYEVPDDKKVNYFFFHIFVKEKLLSLFKYIF